MVATLCGATFRFFDRGNMVVDYLVAIVAIIVGSAVGWFLYGWAERLLLRLVSGLLGVRRKPLVTAPAE